MNIIKGALLTIALSLSVLLHASELTIEISQGVDNPTPIAVAKFAWKGKGEKPAAIDQVIISDLAFSGLFKILPQNDMLSQPSRPDQVFMKDWRLLGQQFLLIGEVSESADQNLQVSYYLYDVSQQRKILSEKVVATRKGARNIAHLIADRVYEEITGVKGAFSTKILYVSAKKLADNKFNYKLYRADFDGKRPFEVLNSSQPILSPTWSPDGKRIAYVSFENKRPAIFIQELATGKREKLTNFKGLNSAPAFSPDGKRLAMVLSKDGTPDIYIMNIATKSLKKVAPNNFAIDTEPAWMPDGKSLVFTSNRGGSPQIYHVSLATGKVKRLTFQGRYNARALPLADGSGFILVHKSSQGFHIARFDPRTNRMFVLTNTNLDESPSIAANGSMVMYAAKRRNQGVLAVVSVDGNVKTVLPPADSRSVREPAWSPFIQ